MRIAKSAIAAIAVAGIIGFAGLAGAHAQKQRFTPGPNHVLTTDPQQMELVFTEPLKSAQVDVFDVYGHSVTTGIPTVNPAEPQRVTAPLQAGLPEGTYTVKWHTLSVDGHTAAGRYKFHVTTPGTADVIRVFHDGREVTGDVPARIVDGRTLVPVRALTEAMGKWVDWDPEQRFVILSDAPSAHMHHKTYAHPSGSPAPALKLTIEPDAKSGFNVHLDTTDWTWAPEQVNTAPVPNTGHAHLYVDGIKVARLYGPWYHLEGLSPGQHDVYVTLNANDHSDYAAGDQGVIGARHSVVHPPKGEAAGGHGH